MTQALMPGDEPIEIKFKPKEAPVTQREAYSSVLPGCGCAMCRRNARYERELRERDRAQMVAQYGGWVQGERTPPAPVPPFNGSIAGFIRGRYDFNLSAQPDSGLHGQVRWRRPGTLEVYDAQGLRQWTYAQEQPGGVLIDWTGRMWRPEPEPIPASPSIFNGDTGPLACGDLPGIIRGAS